MEKVRVNPERNYGIDLLRILSMLMIVMIHTLGRSGLLDTTPPLSPAHEVFWALEILCYGGVNCFILISGYIGWKGEFKASRILRLWLQVLFYSLGFEVLYQAVSGAWDGMGILRACFPITRNTYWFFTQYIVLCFLMPFLNRLIRGQTVKQNLRLAGILLFFISLLSTAVASPLPIVGGTSDIFSVNRGYGVLWFMTLYLTGAAIGRRQEERKEGIIHPGRALAVFFGSHLITWIIRFITEWSLGREGAWYAVNYTAPLMVTSSIALLLWSSRVRPGRMAGSIIAFLTPGIFGVYLIHSNPRIYPLYVKGVEPLASMNLAQQLLGLAVISAAVLVVCCLADRGRDRWFHWMGLSRWGQKLDKKVNNRIEERGNQIHGSI